MVVGQSLKASFSQSGEGLGFSRSHRVDLELLCPRGADFDKKISRIEDRGRCLRRVKFLRDRKIPFWGRKLSILKGL